MGAFFVFCPVLTVRIFINFVQTRNYTTMKKLFTLLAMAFALYACQMPQITDENIESAIQSGQFAQVE